MCIRDSIYIDGQEFTLVPSVPMKGLAADRNIRIFTALIVSDNVFESYINPDTVVSIPAHSRAKGIACYGIYGLPHQRGCKGVLHGRELFQRGAEITRDRFPRHLAGILNIP